ncbi:CcmD family protein [Robertmurraya sp. DFI.2.37]|jgi:CcmD family protein|nr:CcmD family protein [Robertmurraya sp. DFI.2.37]MDF1506802.1 CcmD family protein [Robertmurraya sp. DFI.2.37]
MNYLFIAYTVTWALIAGYIMVLGKRQMSLKKELKQLEEWNSEQ